jgi:ribonuclease P protein component
MDFAPAWRPRTAGSCSSAAAPKAESGSRRRTTELLVRATNHAPAKVRQAFRKGRRLRARREFQLVYAEGQRYDGRLLAAFLRRNELAEHRLGITASSKAIGKAVDRNRARRLLRELFRRSTAELNSLPQRYDWVLNAKRSLLAASEELRFDEFRNIIAQVARAERRQN